LQSVAVLENSEGVGGGGFYQGRLGQIARALGYLYSW